MPLRDQALWTIATAPCAVMTISNFFSKAWDGGEMLGYTDSVYFKSLRANKGELQKLAKKLKSSVEIVTALAEISYSVCDLKFICRNPTSFENVSVVCRAWELADEETDTLYWKGTPIHRSDNVQKGCTFCPSLAKRVMKAVQSLFCSSRNA